MAQQAYMQAKHNKEQLKTTLQGEQVRHGALAEANSALHRIESLLNLTRKGHKVGSVGSGG